MEPGEEQARTEERLVHCKDYHRSKTRRGYASVRGDRDRKSICPSWAMDKRLQTALIRTAILDSGGAFDVNGRPKRLWNAVGGVFFVGVSCNVETALYNC
jgi:hypothetical protein